MLWLDSFQFVCNNLANGKPLAKAVQDAKLVSNLWIVCCGSLGWHLPPPSSMAVSYTAPVVCLVRRWTVVWPKVWWRNWQLAVLWKHGKCEEILEQLSHEQSAHQVLYALHVYEKLGPLLIALISQSSVGDFSNCKPISCKMCLIQVSSIAVVAIERLSVLDQDTVCCFLELYEMQLPLR